MFFVISIFSMYSLWLNYNGDALTTDGDNLFIDYFTIGNQKGIEPNEDELDAAEDELERINDN